MAKIKTVPNRWIRIAPGQVKTVATRNSATGMFTGRKAVSGKGDTTNARYLVKTIDWDRDGKIEEHEHGGTIHGRTIKVKGSRRAKGYERRI